MHCNGIAVHRTGRGANTGDMEVILVKVAVFVLIIALGYILKRAGVFRQSDFRVFSDITLYITLPCAVISNFSRIGVESRLLLLVLAGALCNLVTIAAGYLAGSGRGRQVQAFNMINYSGYNIGCFTLPYIQSMLGPSGVIAACLFDAGNSLFCTGATYSMAAAVSGSGEKSTAGMFFRRMFSSVPMNTYIVMVALSLLHVRLPGYVTSFTDTVGAANPFMAMMMLGVGFDLHLDRSKVRAMGRILIHRYLIAAVLAWIFYSFSPFPEEVRKVLAIISFAPLSAVCAIFTSRCHGDVSMSCTLNSLSIIISIAFMTSLMILL